jgi:ureidoacrylate peracid hydrolase
MKIIIKETAFLFLLFQCCIIGFAQKKQSQIIKVSAKPIPIEIETSKTAVIVIDMQNDFGSKGGMFERAGIDISSIQSAVVPISMVLSYARKSGIQVIYLKVAIKSDMSDLGDYGSPYRNDLMRVGVGDTVHAPDGSFSRIQIRDTWNTEILDQLKPDVNDIVLYKSRFSGFYKTELDSVLKKLNIKYLIVTGCTTSVCVESTVRDAVFRNYSPIVLEDCTAEPIGEKLLRTNKEASLLLMQSVFGWVSSSDEFLKAFPH